MSNAKEIGFRKIASNLFKAQEEVKNFSPIEMERKNRTLLCVSKLLADPLVEDKKLVEFLMNGCEGACNKVSQSTAYRDIAAVTRVVGNIQLASKNWYRYMIVEGAKKAYAISELAKDGKGMAAAIDKIGKYTMADKEDNDYDWSQMLPPTWEPTDDVSVLGDDFKEYNEQELKDRRQELRLFFNSKAKDATFTDVEIVEDDD